LTVFFFFIDFSVSSSFAIPVGDDSGASPAALLV
jgi:hypothetical protein